MNVYILIKVGRASAELHGIYLLLGDATGAADKCADEDSDNYHDWQVLRIPFNKRSDPGLKMPESSSHKSWFSLGEKVYSIRKWEGNCDEGSTKEG